MIRSCRNNDFSGGNCHFSGNGHVFASGIRAASPENGAFSDWRKVNSRWSRGREGWQNKAHSGNWTIPSGIVTSRVGMVAIPVGNAAIPPGKIARRIGKMIFPAGNLAISPGDIPAPVATEAILMGRETAPVETDKVQMCHETIHIRNQEWGRRNAHNSF